MSSHQPGDRIEFRLHDRYAHRSVPDALANPDRAFEQLRQEGGGRVHRGASHRTPLIAQLPPGPPGEILPPSRPQLCAQLSENLSSRYPLNDPVPELVKASLRPGKPEFLDLLRRLYALLKACQQIRGEPCTVLGW